MLTEITFQQLLTFLAFGIARFGVCSVGCRIKSAAIRLQVKMVLYSNNEPNLFLPYFQSHQN